MKHNWQSLIHNLDDFYIERAYHYTCRAPLYGPRHRHDDKFHIAYLMVGHSNIEIKGEMYQVGPSDAIFIPPRQTHGSTGDGKTYFELIEVHFRIKQFRKIFHVPSLPAVLHVYNPATLVPALERLVAGHLIDASSENWLAKVRLAEVLMLLARETSWSSVSDWVNRDMERKIQQAVDYIAVHYVRPLSVPLLAELVNMSPSYFAAGFKKVTGTSPLEFVIKRRMHHAKELLCNSDFSIGQIAAMCGFAYSQYFDRLFRRREKISPTGYRGQSKRERSFK